MQTNLKDEDVRIPPIKSPVLAENQFRINEVPSGSALLVGDVAVFNVAGTFCATQAT